MNKPLKPLRVPALLFASLLLLGCSSSSDGPIDGGATCPVSPDCPARGVPSYKTDIVPILAQSCIGCHGPDGAAGFYETSYAAVHSQASPILDQVAYCMMPPPNGTQLTAAQRVALTAWLECGAPDN